ncbi:MAG: T9SS type A sorting domain-containing protein [Candidatus Marinimicrobia bacterium]|nr:T9SS type A sorting domain-containing protein [Candidatus Neomarinimicrobiota bacterium]
MKYVQYCLISIFFIQVAFSASVKDNPRKKQQSRKTEIPVERVRKNHSEDIDAPKVKPTREDDRVSKVQQIKDGVISIQDVFTIETPQTRSVTNFTEYTVCSVGCDYDDVMTAINSVPSFSTIFISEPGTYYVSDIQLEEKSIWIRGLSPEETILTGENPDGLDSNLVYFEKLDYADWTLEENQDRIADSVWITRGDNQPIFNAAVEAYNDTDTDLTPTNTLWAQGRTADVDSSDYETFAPMTGWCPPCILGQTLSLKLPGAGEDSSDVFYDLVITQWTQNGAGGGFAYYRGEPGVSLPLSATMISLSDSSENDTISYLQLSDLSIVDGSGSNGSPGGILIDENTYDSTTVVFENVHGTNHSGGFLRSYSNNTAIYINNSEFFNNNSSNDGGVIYLDFGDLNINNSEFFNNNSSNDGGVSYLDFGDLNINNSEFSNNTTNGDGGVFYIDDGNYNINNSEFSNNSSNDDGGVIYHYDAEGMILNSAFTHNSSGDDGGVINNESGDLYIGNSHFSENESSYGGAIYMDYGDDFVTFNTSFENNIATSSGGAIYIEESADGYFYQTHFHENMSGNEGGAFYIENYEDDFDISVEFHSSSFVENIAEGDGGAIFSYDDYDGRIKIYSSVFDGNSSESDGGAIYIDDDGELWIENSSFVRNSAGDDGGAIYNDDADSPGVIMINTTIANNSASDEGGAIINDDYLFLYNCTVAFNDAGYDYGGIDDVDDMSSTVIAQNTVTGDDYSYPDVDYAYISERNIIGNIGEGSIYIYNDVYGDSWIGNPDSLGTIDSVAIAHGVVVYDTPINAQLAFVNDEPLPYMIPYPGSLAIDNGIDWYNWDDEYVTVNYDMLGRPRSWPYNSDIGAIERTPGDPHEDQIAPGTIDDLAGAPSIEGGIQLSWTAVGSDGNIGTVAEYMVYYSANTFEDPSESTVMGINPGINPSQSGTNESFLLGGLDYGSAYYIRIITFDEIGQPSDLSNEIAVETLNAPSVAVSTTSASITLPAESEGTRQLTLGNDGQSLLEWSATILTEDTSSVRSSSPVFGTGTLSDLEKSASDYVNHPRPENLFSDESFPLDPHMQSVLSSRINANPLENILSMFEEKHQTIIDLVPNPWVIEDGVTGDNINDGGDDMYDGGNYLSTDNEQNPLAYSDSVIIASSHLGETGQYFTRKYDELFVFAADLDSVSDFYITGNLGADGSGSVDGIIVEESGYTGFVKRVYNAGDPSINHMVIIQNTEGASHDFSTDTNNDYHHIGGLINVTQLYYILYASSGGALVDDETTLSIMSAMLDIIDPTWLHVSENQGEILPGETQLIEILFNTTELADTSLAGLITLTTNDPNVAEIPIDVSMVVSSENLSPVLHTAQLSDAIEDEPYLFQLVGEDPNGDTIHYTLVDGPSWMSISESGEVTGMPTNENVSDSDTLSVNLNDGTVDISFGMTVTVINSNDSPFVLNGFEPVVVNEDSEPITIDLSQIFSDDDMNIELDSLIYLAEGFMTFRKENNADWTLEENQDRVNDAVWITRKNNQSIFNIMREDGYSQADGSPQGTEWSLGYASQSNELMFEPFISAVSNSPQSSIGKPLVMHTVDDNHYYNMMIHQWTGGNNGGGLAWTRSSVENNDTPIATPEINGSNLTIYFHPNAFGETELVILAIDESGETVADSLSIMINPVNDLPGDVALLHPADNSTISILNPTLSWEEPIDFENGETSGSSNDHLVKNTQTQSNSRSIASYNVYVGTDTALTAEDFLENVAINSYTISSDLVDDATYFWMVEAVDDDGGISTSDTWSFTINTGNNPPSSFELVSPSPELVLYSTDVTFEWMPSYDPDPNDNVHFALNVNSDTLHLHYETDSISYLASQFQDNKVYHWSVDAYDNYGAMVQNIGGPRMFVVNTANDNPSSPELVAPLSGSIQTNLMPSFFWTRSHDIDPMDHVSYELSWQQIGDALNPHIINTDSNGVSLEENLEDNSSFIWSVRAMDLNNGESLTDTMHFYTDAFPEPPLAFVTLSPENEATGLGTEVEFVWAESIDPDPIDDIHYQLVYATDWQDSSTYVFSENVQDTSLIISMENNTLYYWGVIARDNDGFMVGSNDNTPNTMVIGTLGIDDQAIPDAFALHQNYPNPFNPTTTLRYDLPEDTHVQIVIYDIMGQQVKTLINEEQNAGFKAVVWDATNHIGQPVSAGMYLYQISAGGFNKTIKMVLLK